MRRAFWVLEVLILSIALGWLACPALADYKQAVAYYMQGRYDRAIQELKPDLDQNPDWESGHRLLGLCYLNLKNNALAVSSLARAVQLKSPALTTYIGLGQGYFNMQRYGDCIQALNQGEPLAAKEKETEQFRFYLLRGSSFFRLEKWNEALSDLTHAIRINQSDYAAYSMLGIAYYSLGRVDEAILALEKALSMNSTQSAAAEFLGKAYFKKGIAALSGKEYSAAVQLFLKARSYNPKDGYIHYNLAEAYLFQKNYLEAEKALNLAIELMPKNPDVLMRMGLVCEKQKKWDQALNAYGKANELKPSQDLKDAIGRVTELKKGK